MSGSQKGEESRHITIGMQEEIKFISKFTVDSTSEKHLYKLLACQISHLVEFVQNRVCSGLLQYPFCAHVQFLTFTKNSCFSFYVTGPVVYVLDLADRLISKACPFAAAGIMVGSIYWTAVTYGAVTVMQVQINCLNVTFL